MNITPYHSKGNREWIAMFKAIRAAGSIQISDLAPTIDVNAATVRERLEKCEHHGLVSVHRAGKRNTYSAPENWEELLTGYFADRAGRMSNGGKRIEQPIPGSAELLAAARAVRSDVRTTWRMPEHGAKAAA